MPLGTTRSQVEHGQDPEHWAKRTAGQQARDEEQQPSQTEHAEQARGPSGKDGETT